ncbi:MAG: hypothetical protein S4CHLAM6_08900 [Chlamydiae bacterium]|nr:hypothetical protein [Chlamydiota bacterium]
MATITGTREWTGAEVVGNTTSITDITGGVDPIRSLGKQGIALQDKSFKLKTQLAQLARLHETVEKIERVLNKTLLDQISMAIPQVVEEGRDSPSLQERLFDQHNQVLEDQVLAEFKKIQSIHMSSDDAELQGLITLFSSEVTLIINQLENADYYKGKAVPAVFMQQIETLNARLFGINEGKREEAGLLSVLREKAASAAVLKVKIQKIEGKAQKIITEIKRLIRN